MRVVMDLRDRLISNRMTHADAKETQQKVTSKMDLINSRQHLDLVVRDEEGNVLSALRYVSLISNRIEKLKGISFVLSMFGPLLYT